MGGCRAIFVIWKTAWYSLNTDSFTQNTSLSPPIGAGKLYFSIILFIWTVINVQLFHFVKNHKGWRSLQNIERKSCKNNKKYSKRSAVRFEEISCDQSEGQVSSHNRIVTYIIKFGQDTIQRIYTKQELTRLSGAYGVETTSRTNKTTMATTLVPVIRSCSSVPNPYVLNNYRILANTDDNAKLVVLRIARLC